jgi:hypothetical protein
LVRKIFLTAPPVDKIFRKIFYNLVKILGNVGQNMTTPPPPKVNGFATSLGIAQFWKTMEIWANARKNQENSADLSENRLNSDNFITILHKNLGISPVHLC